MVYKKMYWALGPAFHYAVLQRGDLHHLRDNVEAWAKAYMESVHDDYNALRPWVAPRSSLIDIGCGVGACAAFFIEYEGCRAILIDGLEADARVDRQDRPFMSESVHHTFMENCGIGPSKYQYFDPDNLPVGPAVETIISLRSYCFHYPPSVYMHFVKARSKVGTRLIFDVRRARPEWRKELRENFAELSVIEEGRKYDRVVFERREYS